MTDSAPDSGPKRAAPTGETATRRRPDFLQVLGELLLTLGVIVFLFAFYESYWTNIESGKMQAQADEKLDEQWQQRVNPRQKITPEIGDAFARMYIPSFGSDFQFAIVEGVEDANLVERVPNPADRLHGRAAARGRLVSKPRTTRNGDHGGVCERRRQVYHHPG